MAKAQIIESFITQGQILEQESKNDAILCRAKYQICSIGEKNRNNRVYEKGVWDKVLADQDILDKLKNKSLFFHAEHPTTTQSNTEKVAGVVTNLTLNEEEKKVYATMEVLDTPYGRIVDTLLRAGCGIGVSTRADGELEETLDEAGNKFQRVVPESYRFVTIDFTADPSTFGSELPIAVERDVTKVISGGLDDSKLDRDFATVLLETMHSPEAVALLESIKNDKHHADCGCKASEKKCTKGCTKAIDETVYDEIEGQVFILVSNGKTDEEITAEVSAKFDLLGSAKELLPSLIKRVRTEVSGKNEDIKETKIMSINRDNEVKCDSCKRQLQDHEDYVHDTDTGENICLDCDNDSVNEVIKKVGSKWQVQSHKGRNLGTYDTEAEAKKRLGQVEFFKHKNEKYTTSSDTSGQPANAKAADKVAKKSAAKNKIKIGEQEVQTCSKCGEALNSIRQGSMPHRCKYDGVTTEGVKVDETQINAKVESFLLDNWGKFIDHDDAVRNVVKIFKIGESDAKQFVETLEKSKGKISAVSAVFNEKALPSGIDQLEMPKRLAILAAERKQLVENYGKDAMTFTVRIDELNKQLEEIKVKEADYYRCTAENAKIIKDLKEQLVKANEDAKILKESNDTAIKALQEERVADVKRLTEEKQSELTQLKEEQRKDFIKFYVSTKIKSMGLRLPEAVLTLLESCKTVEEVDAQIRKTQNALRENLVQSAGGLSEIVIEAQSDPNPNLTDIRNKVGIVLKHLGV